MEIEEGKYFYRADKHGVQHRLWIEDSSSKQDDWDSVLELCLLCFLNDREFVRECPDDNLRPDFLRQLFQWEYQGSGMFTGGSGSVVCVKSVPEDSTNDDNYKIIAATTVTTDWNDLPLKLPPELLEKMKKKLAWEDEIFEIYAKTAAELNTVFWYWPYHVVHPDFQGSNIGTSVFKLGMEMLHRKHVKIANKTRQTPIQNPPLGLGICTNPRTLKFAQKYLKEFIVGHWHYPNSDSVIRCYEKDDVANADCYWLVLTPPTNETVLNVVRKKFGYYNSKL